MPKRKAPHPHSPTRAIAPPGTATYRPHHVAPSCRLHHGQHLQHLYIGITNNLPRRIDEHKSGLHPASFPSRYRLDKLVHYEQFTTFPAAIAREKHLKGWRRSRKIQLIVTTNPTWRDLSLDWGTPTEPFNETQLTPPQTF